MICSGLVEGAEQHHCLCVAPEQACQFDILFLTRPTVTCGDR